MTKKVTLYYADWCPHCVSYKPEWESIKKVLNSKGIKTAEFEHGQHKNIIEKANVSGFPTLHYDDGAGNVEIIMDRSTDGILTKVGINSIQSGGGNNNQILLNNQLMLNDIYYKKYMKYKSKYLSSIKSGGANNNNNNNNNNTDDGDVTNIYTHGLLGTDFSELLKKNANSVANEKPLTIDIDSIFIKPIEAEIDRFKDMHLLNLNALDEPLTGDNQKHEQKRKQADLSKKLKELQRDANLFGRNQFNKMREFLMNNMLDNCFTHLAREVVSQTIVILHIGKKILDNKKGGHYAALDLVCFLAARMSINKSNNIAKNVYFDWSIYSDTTILQSAAVAVKEMHFLMALIIECIALIIKKEDHTKMENYNIEKYVFNKIVAMNKDVRIAKKKIGDKAQNQIKAATEATLV